MVRSNNYKSNWIILLLVISIVTFVSSTYFIHNEYQGAIWKVTVTSLTLMWLVSYFVSTTLCFKSVYLFFSAYIIPLILFHLGITIPDAFGLFDKFGWGDNSFGKWLAYSGYYTVLALSCLGIGMSISVMLARDKTDQNIPPPHVLKCNLSIAYQDGIGLFLASIVFLCMAIYTFGNILNYSRVDFFRGVGDTRGLGVFLMTFPSSLILLTIGATNKRQKYFSAIATIIGCIFLLLSGYRAMAMFPIMVGMVVWCKTGRKIPYTFAILLLVATIIAIPALSALRSIGSYSEISTEKIDESIEQSTVQETFRTLGQTGGVAAHVIRLVPDVDPYRYGATYVDALRNSIPNVLPGMNKNRRQAAKQKAFSDQSAIPEMMPSDWLTYRIAKQKFDRGEGVGFSGLIEPYLNFGYAGVLIFFTVLGFYLGRLEVTNIMYHPNLIVFCSAMYWPFTRSVRNDIATFIKPAVFILIIIFVWRLIKNNFFSASKASQSEEDSVNQDSSTDNKPIGTERVFKKRDRKLISKKS